MNGKTAYKILLHCTSIHVRHAVQLHVALEYCTHCLAKFLLVTVTSCTDWLLRLLTIYTKHGIDKSADEVILQRNVALLLDILLLGHPFSVNLDAVFPLVAITVTLVALSVLAEEVHVIPVHLRLRKYLKGSTAIVSL